MDDVADAQVYQGLIRGDFITEIDGCSLIELDSSQCERVFRDSLWDGVPVIVEACCSSRGMLPHLNFDVAMLHMDLTALAVDYGVTVEFRPGQPALLV